MYQKSSQMNNLILNGNEYIVVKLLGRGKSGYSYLVRDNLNNLYVLKAIHHEKVDYYTFGDKLRAEMAAYKKLTALGILMPKLFAVDYDKEYILKEYIDGPIILDLVKSDQVPEAAFTQIKAMLTRLYAANTNIDYFPTNFVWYNNLLYYVDYECNDYMEAWNFENWGIKYWTKTNEFLAYLKGNK